MIVAWSKRTENSSDAAWVFNEVDEAQRKKLPIIPVQLEPCDIPLGYRHVQAANLAGWRGDSKNPEWQEVLDGVRAAIEGRAVGGAATRRAAPAAPAPKRGGSPLGPIVGIIALIALAGGGYFAWTLLGPRTGATTQIASQSAVQIGPNAAPSSTLTLNEAEIRAQATKDFAAPSTQAPPGRKFYAQTVNYAGGSQTGFFQRESGTVWGEYQAGARTSDFRLVSDSDTEVVLYDQGRDMTVRLDLAAKKIFWRQAKGAENPLYTIVSVNQPPAQAPAIASTPIAKINFKTGDGVTGSFRREQGDAWGEYTANGERAFQFKQRAQTADKLELFDASRNMTITIDIPGKRIAWREGAGPNNPLYEVVSVER